MLEGFGGGGSHGGSCGCLGCGRDLLLNGAEEGTH